MVTWLRFVKSLVLSKEKDSGLANQVFSYVSKDVILDAIGVTVATHGRRMGL